MRDKYDDAIEYLTTNPDKIFETWAEPQRRKGGCLFSAVTPSGRIWEERRRANVRVSHADTRP